MDRIIYERRERRRRAELDLTGDVSLYKDQDDDEVDIIAKVMKESKSNLKSEKDKDEKKDELDDNEDDGEDDKDENGDDGNNDDENQDYDSRLFDRKRKRKSRMADDYGDEDDDEKDNIGRGRRDLDDLAEDNEQEEEQELEPLNFNREKEIGLIDKNGALILSRREVVDVSDPWLDSIDEDIKNGKIKKQSKSSSDLSSSQNIKKRMRNEDELKKKEKDPIEQLRLLTFYLQYFSEGDENFTPAELLQTLGKDMKRYEKLFNLVTEASDTLLNNDYPTIYRDSLRKLNMDNIQEVKLAPSSSNWEYTIKTIANNSEYDNKEENINSSAMTSQDPQIYGPYTPEMMESWRLQGYFTMPPSSNQAAYFRRIGSTRWMQGDDIEDFFSS